MQATRIRPDAGPFDRRRLAAAGLSVLIPGLGQLFNRRPRLAGLFLIPSLLLCAVVFALVQTQSPARLAAWAVAPQVLSALLTLNLLALVWRLVALGQASLDTRRAGPAGRLGLIGIGLLMVVVALPHLVVYRSGTILGDTFRTIFSSQVLSAVSGPTPSSGPTPRDGVVTA